MQLPPAELPSNRELRWFAPVGLACLLAPTFLPHVENEVLFNPLRWAFAAWGAWILIWSLAWQRRALNRLSPTDAPFPDLGWGNRLTLLRGMLLAALGGFILQPVSAASWLPALCYGCAALLDRFDGEVARRTRRCTELGAALDTLYDALGLVVAPLVAVMLGKLDTSYLLTSVAYYWFVAGLYWRRFYGLPVHSLAPSPLRRTLAGCQMGFVALALWPSLSPVLTQWLGFCFMLPLLVGFIVDWLQVSGRYNPSAQHNVARRDWVASYRDTALLPVLRIAVALLFLSVAHASEWPLLETSLLCAALIAGVLARAVSIVLLLWLAWQFRETSLTPGLYVITAGAVGVVVFGGGRFSLWTADDALVRRDES